MDELAAYTVSARLTPRSDTATLLRIVSILHSRGATVRQLAFDADDPNGATVTAQVTLSNAGWVTLLESLRRPVDVTEVFGGVDVPVATTSLSTPAGCWLASGRAPSVAVG